MSGDPTSEPASVTIEGASAGGPAEGRAAYVISQLYYYLAAVVGVGLVIGGVIVMLFGVRTWLFPGEFESSRDGVRGILLGVSFALPGLASMWWHLRQARAREGRVLAGAFWGSALYFHAVAFIAFLFVLGGSIGLLAVLANAVVPPCTFVEGFGSGGTILGARDCRAEWDEIGRSLFNAAIFIVAAGPLMWWHLRQGRRLTTPPPEVDPV